MDDEGVSGLGIVVLDFFAGDVGHEGAFWAAFEEGVGSVGDAVGALDIDLTILGEGEDAVDIAVGGDFRLVFPGAEQHVFAAEEADEPDGGGDDGGGQQQADGDQQGARRAALVPEAGNEAGLFLRFHYFLRARSSQIMPTSSAL